MVRGTRKKQQPPVEPVEMKKPTRSRYERKATTKSLIKSPSIKTYLHVVECVTKEYSKIEKSELDVCSKSNCVTDYFKNKAEIITDQPCQITETTFSSPVTTPHRIKLENSPPKKVVFAPKSRKTLKFSQPTQTQIKEFFPIRRSNRKTKKIVLEEKKQSLKDAISSEIETGLEIRYFENKGRGIVATKEFQRGDFVVEYRGDLIDAEEAKRREQIYARDQNAGCYMYYFKHSNRQYCVDATAESKYLGRLVNHSRNGNLMTRIEELYGVPHLVLIAKDIIEVGQEVTYDYGDRSKESLKHHPWLLE